ncbi:MAG: hypothetical protein ACOYL3_15280, partial [Desulfuromonadaceae bacterium]
VNLTATTDPAATDDSGAGYAVGSRWVDTVSKKEYVLTDATATAAVWKETTASISGLLVAANNLSDLTNAATARTNLGLSASATTDSTNASNLTSGTVAAARGGAGTVSGLLKADGAGTVTAATVGTDYLSPSGNGSALTGLTKTQVNLANVDNTTDAGKPVSTATQTALDLKAPLASPTFTGTVTAANLVGPLTGNVTGNLSGNATTATSATTATTAGNVTGTVAIANGGTGQITATAAFNALVPAQTGNNSKYLTTDGTNTSWGSPPGAAGWSVVSGTTQTAASGGSYLTTNASQAAVTLPATPAAGDVVRVMAKNGSGGWLVAANTDQVFGLAGIGSGAWTARGPNNNFYCVASSSDGSKLAAGSSHGIYTSSDSGVSWTLQTSTPLNSFNWNRIASSRDGVKLAALPNTYGYIYTSVDSGVTWVRGNTEGQWYSIASSDDGTKLVAGAISNWIYTSSDSGATWVQQTASPSGNWLSVASSSDGEKLAAVDTSSRQIYTSSDSGASWTPGDTERAWNSVASSSDGTKLVATVSGGQIYTSSNSGVNWVVQAGSPTAYWRDSTGVASSSDGTKLAAVVFGGRVYTSTDSGVSWTARDSNRNWRAIASNSEGNKLVAVDESHIYTSPAINRLSGGSRAGADFLYDGSGEWLLLNTQGTVTVQ